MLSPNISTLKIAELTGMGNIAIVQSIERNMDAMIAVGGCKPVKKKYTTKGRSGHVYLLNSKQEKLLMLLSNNRTRAVLYYKICLASNGTFNYYDIPNTF